MTTNRDSNHTSLKAALHALFLSHPNSIGEDYFEHQRAALKFAGALGVTAIAAFIHALVPGLCQSTARTRIESLHLQLQRRTPSNCGKERHKRNAPA